MHPLDKARAATKARLLAGEKAYKNPLEKAKESPHSLRFAINGMCYDCIGRDGDPDWRGSIRNCICTECPLYPLRPYQDKSCALNK